MADEVLGIIVTGGEGSPLAGLGFTHARALTPFAGRYRFLDFALATTSNSGIRQVSLASVPDDGTPRFPRILAACQRAAATFEPDWIAVLAADHILQTDVRPLLGELVRTGADVGLLALPPQPDDGSTRARVATREGLDLVWSGDLVARASALPALTEAFAAPGTANGHTASTLLQAARTLVYDAARPSALGPRLYWHDPQSLEAYYDSQMDLCTPEPALDLYDPRWPIRSATSGLPPAKVTCDSSCGHMGQAINTLLADGCVIRGGAVIRSIVGPACVVEAGAEVEDSVLLEGCRIARGARVRRALIGPGVVVGENEEVGYDQTLRLQAHRLASGLTLLPAAGTSPALALAAH